MRIILTGFVLLFFATGCGTFDPNPALKKPFDVDRDTGYRFKNLELGENNSDELFIIVALSGGGIRASALSYGLLDALRKTRIDVGTDEERSLLDEVDIISSVSGGSFTSAFYAAHKECMFRAPDNCDSELTDGEKSLFEHKVLNRNLLHDLERLVFKPQKWLKLFGRSYGSSDLVSEFYHRELFNKMYYRDMPEDRPFFVINSTDLSFGTQFPFIQDQFDLLCTDLGGIKLARAVATSSAVPGGLSPLTYQNHAYQKPPYLPPPECGFVDYPWVEEILAAKEDDVNQKDDPRRNNLELLNRAQSRRTYYDPLVVPPRRYVHLVDGGLSDNLGLRGILFAMNSEHSSYSIKERLDLDKIKRLVVIAVNASTSGEKKKKIKIDDKAKVPSRLKGITAAATLPMQNYSVDTIKRMQLEIDQRNDPANDDMACLESCKGQPICSLVCLGAENKDDEQENREAVDFYFIDIAFDFVEVEKTREQLMESGAFGLPDWNVDLLTAAGCNLLNQDYDFYRLFNDTPQFFGLGASALNGSKVECQECVDVPESGELCF